MPRAPLEFTWINFSCPPKIYFCPPPPSHAILAPRPISLIKPLPFHTGLYSKILPAENGQKVDEFEPIYHGNYRYWWKSTLSILVVMFVYPNLNTTRCVWKVTGLCTLHEQLLSQKKSIAFYDVTMSYAFKNQISAFCDNCIPFKSFFFVKALALWPFCEKFDKIK